MLTAAKAEFGGRQQRAVGEVLIELQLAVGDDSDVRLGAVVASFIRRVEVVDHHVLAVGADLGGDQQLRPGGLRQQGTRGNGQLDGGRRIDHHAEWAKLLGGCCGGEQNAGECDGDCEAIHGAASAAEQMQLRCHKNGPFWRRFVGLDRESETRGVSQLTQKTLSGWRLPVATERPAWAAPARSRVPRTSSRRGAALLPPAPAGSPAHVRLWQTTPTSSCGPCGLNRP